MAGFTGLELEKKTMSVIHIVLSEVCDMLYAFVYLCNTNSCAQCSRDLASFETLCLQWHTRCTKASKHHALVGILAGLFTSVLGSDGLVLDSMWGGQARLGWPDHAPLRSINCLASLLPDLPSNASFQGP